MLGIIFYTYTAIGLGLLLPAIRATKFLNFGARFTAGYSLLTLYIYVAHILVRLSLDLTVWSVLILATIGIGYSFYREKFRYLSTILMHPTFILIVIGMIGVLMNGGIDYIPFTIDEFTNWLGASREIYLHGDYESVRKSLHLSGYTPGWRLLLLLPWQIAGAIEEGLSAAAPFVLHTAVAALVFDIAVYLFRSVGRFSETSSVAFGWVFLVMLLGAEAMGKLWTYSLLIEQPQIYSTSAVFLFLYLSSKLASSEETPKSTLYIYAGITLAACYLIKAAAILLIPTIAIFAAVPILSRHFIFCPTWKLRLRFGLLTLVPVLIILVTWTIMNPSSPGVGSPISTLSWLVSGDYGDRDVFDLGNRYFSAIWNYTSSYKLLITVGAMLGALLVLLRRRDGSLLLWTGFVILYFASLYWAHLAILSEYDYQSLVSIQRYTRVPLQIFHVLGLMFLLEFVLSVLVQKERWASFFRTKKMIFIAVLIILLFGGWQMRSVYRTVIDTSTRAYQNIDQRILEVKSAATFINSKRGKTITEFPKIVFIAQPLDRSSTGFAKYFSLFKDDAGRVFSSFKAAVLSSWPREPKYDYQNSLILEEYRNLLRTADVIWPIKIDVTLTTMIVQLGVNEKCVSQLLEHVIVKQLNVENEYFCYRKPNIES